MVGIVARGNCDPRQDQREVYFIEAERTDRVKIGVSNCAYSRMKDLSKMCPVPLRLLGVAFTDKAGTLEKELHLRFAHLREHGEWFRCDPEISSYIEAETTIPKPPRFGPGGMRLAPGQPIPLGTRRR